MFWFSPPIILCFTSWSWFGALSCFCMKLSCKGHLVLRIRLKLFWSEILLWNGGATSSKPNVLLYRSHLPKPHQLLMQTVSNCYLGPRENKSRSCPLAFPLTSTQSTWPNWNWSRINSQSAFSVNIASSAPNISLERFVPIVPFYSLANTHLYITSRRGKYLNAL